MTHPLRVVAQLPAVTPIRGEVEALRAEQNALLLARVHKWVMWYTEIGRAMYLDECPGVSRGDIDFVIGWLEGEGFKVVRPRWFGRVRVFLAHEA